jgi:hypothetical protein
MEGNDIALAWLRSTSADIISWNTHHFSMDHPFRSGWVDVFCPQLCDAVGWNWAWTVESPDTPVEGDGDAPDEFVLTVPKDAQLEMLPDPDRDRPGTPLQACLRLDDGRVLDLNWLLDDDTGEWADYRQRYGDDSDWRWQRDLAWSMDQGTEPVEIDGIVYPPAATAFIADDGRTWLAHRVWTPTAISSGLTRWAADVAGRDDLQFSWDPQLPVSPVVQAAVDRMEQFRAGQLSTIQIAEGVVAVEPAFDWLLSLPPDDAAQITSTLRSAARQLAADEESRVPAWLDTLTDEGRAAYHAGDLDPPEDL